ncbi:unnamed protein product [Gadus morhua 'NCC']
MGNLKFQVKGLKKLKVEPATTSRLEEQKPLGRPSGWNPFPGQTAPDRGQTAPDQGQTPDEPEPQDQGEDSGPLVALLPPTADQPPRKDLAQVIGNQDLSIEAEEEGEATQQAEGKGLRPRFNQWLNLRMKDLSTFAARFQ